MLGRFDAALADPGSAYRALFLTGTYGIGKTALLEQLSQRAARKGWRVIDMGPERVASALARRLVPHSEASTDSDLNVHAGALDNGASASGAMRSKAMTHPAHGLAVALQEACEHGRKGVFVTIDEVQQVTQMDMSAVCDAYQAALRTGHNVVIAVTGSPYAYEETIHHKGCTCMRRAAHEEIGLFERAEAREAFACAMSHTQGLSLDAAALDRLVVASMGQPYLIQLLGYYAVGQAIEAGYAGPHVISEEEVLPRIPLAVETYKTRALAPLFSELSPLETCYLEGMSRTMDDRHASRTSEVTKELGKEQQQLSRARDSLIRNGLIIAPRRGQVRFNIPYLREYVQEDHGQSDAARLAEEWDV